ncbi:MAG TPA: peptidyl-prolyl cis-trans isomerase [Polyangiaceae bacterium]|jgi:parvulin-like peptidyl-prolyl isomerase|nr:peptidyl-prolyl cis-trans isomerase [Polyangiaceae bacterium]
MRAFLRFSLFQWCPLAALLCAVLPAGCREKSKQSPAAVASATAPAPGKLTSELARQVLAKVGDRDITLGEYAETLERMDPFERVRYQSPDRRKQLLNEIIQVELLAEEAKRRGLDKLPETQERVRQMLRDELLRDLRQSVPGPSDIPEAEVRAYFDAHHDEFKEPERRRVAHLLLANEAQAKAALQKALGASAADWGKLVTQVSLDKPAASTGPAPTELAGDLGIVGPPGHPRGANPRVPEALRAAVFEIDKLGGVLDRVVAESGHFHVVRMTGRTEARDRSFQDAERTIRVALVQQRIRAREAELEQELKKRYPVSVDDEALSRVKVPEAEAPNAAPITSAR